MTINRFAVFFFLLFVLQQSALSQYSNLGTPSVKNFIRAEYLAGTQNWSIGQDASGLMYFGNNKGLVIFDGSRWETLELPNETIVRSFAFGSAQKIYAGGQNELGCFYSDPSGFLRFTSFVKKVPESLKSFEDIWKVFNISDTIYFCSKKAIFLFRNDQLIQTVTPDNERFENFYYLNDTLFIQILNQGIYHYDFNSGVIAPYILDDKLLGQRIVELLKPKDRILAITENAGIFELGNQYIKAVRNEASAFLKNNQAYSAIVLNDGKLIAGTVLNGFIKFGESGDVEMHLNKKNGLQNNTVLSLFQDAQENIWLGLDNGIDYAEISSAFLNIGSESGLEGTGYAAFLKDEKLYLGTNQGLYISDSISSKNHRQKINFNLIENSSGQIWSIQQAENRVIVGMHSGAAYLENERLIPFSDIEGGWKFQELADHPGYALEGTYTGFALYKRQIASGTGSLMEWNFVKTLPGFDESARVFEQDREGFIWVSHAYKGLYRIKLSEDLEKFSSISFFTPENGLPDSLFLNVAKIRNEIVVTSPKGVYKFDHDSDAFVPHGELNKIFGMEANVHRLIEDGQGNIWFSINNDFGILRIHEEGLMNNIEISYFNQIQEDLVDGFEHVSALDPAHALIGTEGGFVLYNSALLKTTDFQFDLLIRQVSTTTGKDSLVYRDNGNIHHELMKFKWAMNDLRFDFSAPYYDKIDNVVYRYKLEGFEEEWSEWSDRKYKEYTNLEDKKYTFSVQAKNAYGSLSDVKSFEFKILPPWYRTLFAKLLYTMAILSALFGLLRNVSVREKKKTEAFKKEQEEKLFQKELEFKAESERSENEIVRLKNEKLLADVHHKNSELASATMHLVQKSEILLKLKNDINGIVKETPSGPLNKELRRIVRTIDSDIQLDENWDRFENFFDQVHEDFFKRLRQRFPELTPKDQKLCAYLRMNLTTKEIAPLLNISVRGVEISRYRLRKKLGLDSDVNLVSFILDV